MITRCLIAAGLLMSCKRGAPDPVPDPPVAEPAKAPIVEPSAGLQADLARTTAFHATRPTYETPLGDGQQVPEGLGSMSAETCGACHTEIYAEWQVSVHAAAWIDPQFQAEIAKSGNRWLCLNCHTPLLVQQDLWPVGLQDEDVELPVLVDNPGFDAALRDEGITCAACHVREGVIVGPGLEGSTAPHPVQADPQFRSEAVCLRCHQALATYPGKSFVCTFDTGTEWSEGPWAAEGTDCADCHMPAVERPAAIGGPVRTVARHWWRGAGIPKVAGVHPPTDANPPGLGLDVTWGADVLTVTATNARAGHRLPTGDPERWVQLDVRYQDAEGSATGEPWGHRIGQTWTWHPTPVKTGDNRLAPREARVLTVPIPQGAVSATVVASSNRITEEIADYHHLDDYPRGVVTHRLRVDPDGVTGGLLAETEPIAP